MKNIFAPVIIIFLFCNYTLKGQDYIIKVEPFINSQTVSDAKIKNDTITYLVHGDSLMQQSPIHDLFGIQFSEHNSDKLLLLSYNIDTIVGEVETISKRNIYYRDLNNLLHSIDINNVYCILFNKYGNENINDSIFINYKNIRKQSYIRNSKLIRIDSSFLKISENVGLQKDTINIQLIKNKNELTSTFADTKNLLTYINKEPSDRQFRKSFDNYILDRSGGFFEVNNLNIDRNYIEFNYADNRINDEVKADKNSLIGIFFYDYKQNEPDLSDELPVIVEEVKEEKIKKEKAIPYNFEDAKYTIDFASGFGYMLYDDDTFEFIEVDNDYKESLRRGATIDMSLRVMATRNFGIGIRYNQFFSNNQYKDTLTEKIKIKFLGGTFFGKIPVINDRWLFDIDLTLGFITRSEHFIISEKQYYVSGTTPGLYISTGLEYFFYKNISAGVYLGLMGGSLKEPNINTNYDNNIIFEKPHSLGRFDSLIRIKAYL